MHTRGVCHRDLKPENFLFLSKGTWAWQLRCLDSLESRVRGGFDRSNFQVGVEDLPAFKIQALALINSACSGARVRFEKPSDITGQRIFLPGMGR